MGALEQISELKKKGFLDTDIIQELQDQGITPKEIEDAMDQYQIKNAVLQTPEMQESFTEPQNFEFQKKDFFTRYPSAPLNPLSQNLDSYQPSIQKPNEKTAPTAKNLIKSNPIPEKEESQNSLQKTIEIPKDVPFLPEEPPIYSENESSKTPKPKDIQKEESTIQEDYQINESFPEEDYPPENPYFEDSSNNYDSFQIPQNNIETTIDIAQQVFEEQFKPVEQKISEFSSFKSLSLSKIENITKKISQLEDSIQELQKSINERKNYESSEIKNIKKELLMMQESFAKIINPLLDQTSKKK